jgi:hypothetical protein
MGPRVALVLVLLCSAAGLSASDPGANVAPVPPPLRYLLPIFYNGPGAYGTQWTSELMLWAEEHGTVRDVGLETRLEGAFFTNLFRPELPRVLRVKEASSLGASAIIPIVSEADFRQIVWLPAVPAGAGRVVTLRVYSTEATAFTLHIGSGQRQLRTVKNRPLGPAFASLDLSNLPAGEHELILKSVDRGLWAIASTYDLVTRDLTVRMPAHRR